MSYPKPYWVRPRTRSSSFTEQRFNNSGMTNEEYWVEVRRNGSSRSLVDHGKPGVENQLEGTDRSGRYPMDTKRKAVEHVPQETERMRIGLQPRDKYSHASESARLYQSCKDIERPPQSSSTSGFHTPRSSPHEGAVESVPGPRRDVDDPPRPPPSHRESKPSEAVHTLSEVTSSQTTELSRRYEALEREHESLRSELKTKVHRLEEKESQIRSLKAEITALQRRYDDQTSTLVSTRSDLRSYRSQLDNVQRFISTADAHADQDIIRMLQSLNEEVYQISMTMADFVVDGFARQRKERVSIAENVFTSIGDVMVNHLVMVDNEEIALFLQLAFQCYLSRLVCHVVSSWTVDAKLDSLIGGIYQRLRKAETQSVSGRWRSLTRSHILPTHASEPKTIVEYALTGLSDIVKAASFVSPHECSTASKLGSEFGDKISSIVSHAGRFGNMASEMISGDFEAFVVHPGETFDGWSMVDMNEDQKVPRGKGVAQTVLCGSRVGLRKHMGEKMTMFTKAQVVLRSFLA